MVYQNGLEMLPNIGKLWYVMTLFSSPIFIFIFFSNRQSEKFSWCNVIQQIKKVSANNRVRISQILLLKSSDFTKHLIAQYKINMV